MKYLHMIIAAGLLGAAGLASVSAEILEDWQFNDGWEAPLDSVENSVPGGEYWFTAIGGSQVVPDRNVFRVQRDVGQTTTGWALNNHRDEPVMWLVVDLAGWAFSLEEGAASEYMRFGFVNGYSPNIQNYAEMEFRRVSPEEVAVSGIAQLVSQGAESIGSQPWAVFSHAEDRPLRLVMKVDRAEHFYEIYTNLDGEGHILLGRGALDEGRIPAYFRFTAVNNFSNLLEEGGEDREFVDVDRFFLTNEDPIGDDIIDPDIPDHEPLPEMVLQDWQFNDPEGTPLSETENSVGDAVWTADIGQNSDDPDTGEPGELTAFTTGDGVFRIQREEDTPSDAFADIETPMTGKAWLVVDLAGWNFNLDEGTANESFRWGFFNAQAAQIVAEVRLFRQEVPSDDIPEPDPTAVYMQGQAGGGTGASGLNHPPATPLFQAHQENSVRLVVEYDEDEKAFAIYYNINNQGYELFGEGTTNTARRAHYIRFQALNSFAEEDDYVDVDRIFVTGKNPMLDDDGDGYSVWAEQHFPEGGPDAEAQADPDGDGLANLLEYAFDSDPKVADRSVAPEVRREDGRLTIEFDRNPDATDIRYEVRAADDLQGPWTVIASGEGGNAVTAVNGALVDESEENGQVRVTVSDEVDEGSRRFLELRVTPLVTTQ